MKDPPKGWRWTVRAGAFAAAVFVAGGLALGAQKAPKKTPLKPSYGIPNIVAAVMCLSVLAIPCKRFKRT